MLMHEYTWTTEAQKKLLPEIKTLGWQFSNPIDVLTDAQLKSLKEDSCIPNVCQTYRLTRPWCCPVAQQPTVGRTLLKTERPIAQQMQQSLQKQKREIYSAMVEMERRLQKQFELRDTDDQKTIAFVTGLLLSTLCCCVFFLCLKLYKNKNKKKR